MKLSEKYRVLYRYLTKYKRWAIIGGSAMILGVLLLIPTPLLTMHLIDVVLPSSDVRNLIIICCLCVLVLLLKACCDNVQNYYFGKFNQMVIFDIQMSILKVFQNLSTHYRHQRQTGYLMSRLNDDPAKLQSLFADTLLYIVKDVITLIVGLVIIFSIHWKLAIASIILLPLFILFLKKYNLKIRNLSKPLFESNALYQKKLMESLSLIDTFHVFNAFKYDTIKLVNKKKEYIRADIRKVIIYNIGGSIISIIAGLGPIIVIAYGFFEIMQNRLTLGEFIAFTSFIGYIFGPTSRIVSSSLSMQQSFVAWDRIYEILLLKDNKTRGVKLRNIQGNIEFNNVSLCYADKKILNNISLTITTGKTIAIVGESGGGKSSLVSLITGLNKCTSGDLLIDGININQIDNFNNQIALVEQEPVLFTGTIKDNITFGNNNITIEDVEKAAQIANISDYIESLPQQYETSIDERGHNMSIGQKQRIAIARCIVRNPSIFIMDEPTASLDLDTEYKIINSIKDFLKTRTSIIISHRISSVTFVDEIIVVKDGSIVEVGTHSHLMDQNGYYAHLWHTQNNNI